jgi:hypothetical protein
MGSPRIYGNRELRLSTGDRPVDASIVNHVVLWVSTSLTFVSVSVLYCFLTPYYLTPYSLGYHPHCHTKARYLRSSVLFFEARQARSTSCIHYHLSFLLADETKWYVHLCGPVLTPASSYTIPSGDRPPHSRDDYLWRRLCTDDTGWNTQI